MKAMLKYAQQVSKILTRLRCSGRALCVLGCLKPERCQCSMLKHTIGHGMASIQLFGCPAHTLPARAACLVHWMPKRSPTAHSTQLQAGRHVSVTVRWWAAQRSGWLCGIQPTTQCSRDPPPPTGAGAKAPWLLQMLSTTPAGALPRTT